MTNKTNASTEMLGELYNLIPKAVLAAMVVDLMSDIDGQFLDSDVMTERDKKEARLSIVNRWRRLAIDKEVTQFPLATALHSAVSCPVCDGKLASTHSIMSSKYGIWWRKKIPFHNWIMWCANCLDSNTLPEWDRLAYEKELGW